MTTLRVLLHVAAQRDYELHSLDFSTAFLQGSLHEEIWLRRPPGFTGSFPPGTQWSLRRPVYGLRQAPREWHDTLRTTLAALGFAPSTAGPSLFLRTDTSLPPFYILVYVDDLVFATADTAGLAHVKSELQKRHTCTNVGELRRVLRYLCSTSGMGLVLGGRSPVVLTGHVEASWVDDLATQRSSEGYTFSLGSGSVSWRSTRSSSVLSSSCEAEIYAGAMAAQELRWLTYLLTDLGEPPRSPPVLYVDNKAMLALCREHRLEHRTKHIALRYFLARELQQRGQLRLAYVASQANTADIFTKALQPCDHQRFCTMLVRPAALRPMYALHALLSLLPGRLVARIALQPASLAARARPAASAPLLPTSPDARAPCSPRRLLPSHPAALRPALRAPCCPRPLQPASPAARAHPAASVPCCPRALLLARALLPTCPAASAPCSPTPRVCPAAMCALLSLQPSSPAVNAPCSPAPRMHPAALRALLSLLPACLAACAPCSPRCLLPVRPAASAPCSPAPCCPARPAVPTAHALQLASPAACACPTANAPCCLRDLLLAHALLLVRLAVCARPAAQRACPAAAAT
ncbi:unnamed protein product [Closterium sp. NIES-54]